MTDPAAWLTVGGEFAGYRIEELVARGGMGLVYRAQRLDFTRQTVALKVVAPELAEDEVFRERFKREAGSAASIQHANVLPVHEAREHGGVLFLAMRWVEGRDLREVLMKEGPLAPARAARIVAGVAAALDAAHATGLVHRDVKPANILIEAGSEHVYLTDFGIAKSRDIAGLTGTTQAIGTQGYMAAEQWENKLDPRSDIYALGCVLFETLTGDLPFPNDTPVAMMRAHLEAKPPSVSGRAPPVPGAFDPVIAKALAKKPEKRYPSAGELGHAALVAAAAPMPAPKRERRLGRRARDADVAPPTERTEVEGPPADRTESAARTPAIEPIVPPRPVPRSRRRGVGMLVAALVVLAAVVAAVALPHGGSGPAKRTDDCCVVQLVTLSGKWYRDFNAQDWEAMRRDVLSADTTQVDPEGTWKVGMTGTAFHAHYADLWKTKPTTKPNINTSLNDGSFKGDTYVTRYACFLDGPDPSRTYGFCGGRVLRHIGTITFHVATDPATKQYRLDRITIKPIS